MLTKIKISDKLKTKLVKLMPNKVSKLLLDAHNNGISLENLIESENWVDYLNIKNDNITYIKESSRKRNNVEEPWIKSRQNCNPGQILSRIFNRRFLDININNTEIELFSNKWRADSIDDVSIEILTGWKVLEAFNYDGKMDAKKIKSCANFYHGDPNWQPPMIKWYYIYIYNPESVGILVVRDKKTRIIKARCAIFNGVQISDNGEYKKGEWYRFMNNVYAENEIYKSILINWATQRDIPHMDDGNTFHGCHIISFKTKYKTYPPIDNFRVDLGKNILISRSTNDDSLKLTDMYKAINGGNHLGKNGTKENLGLKTKDYFKPTIKKIK